MMSPGADALVARMRREALRPGSNATVGGFRPPENPLASWLGDVKVAGRHERWPDHDGKPMMPVLQVNVGELPFVPPGLHDLALVTVFIDAEALPAERAANGAGWAVRTSATTDDLVEVRAPAGTIRAKPFPIRWDAFTEDFPDWEHVPGPLAKEFLDLEEQEGISYFDLVERYDITPEAHYATKVGGYPSPWQASGVNTEIYASSPTDEPCFVLQIASEEKCGLMWGDNGFLFLERSQATDDSWFIRWDCA